MATALKGTAMVAAVNKAVTTYGAATVTAAAVTEVTVAWKNSPTASAGTSKVTITGSTSAAGYVYCMVSKDGTRRLLAAAAAATPAANTTTPAATPAPAAAAAAAPYTTMLTDTTLSGKFNFQRAETKDPFSFSLEFSGLSEGKKYAWGCVATSLNPDMMAAEFKTAAVGGDSTTTVTPVVKPSGSSALWSSLIAAFVMIAAIFFY